MAGMANARITDAGLRMPLRVWPGVVIVALQWLLRFALPVVYPEGTMVAVLAGITGGLALGIWWLFFSRAPWLERLGAIAVMIVALIATRPLLHESVATGAMGILFFLLVIPVLSLAFVAWAVASRHLADGPRRAAMVATILLACGAVTLVRTNGFDGSFNNDLAWRWAPTAEERLLAETGDEPIVHASPAPLEPIRSEPVAAAPETTETPSAPAVGKAGDELPALPAPPEAALAPSAASVATTKAEWPGFRGPQGDGVIRGVRIETDWSKSPPIELWRRQIGPGWSSFAVSGDVFFTQEQRGDDEVVAAYHVKTGEPVWRHHNKARFWESNAGAGPRGTPTLSGGRVYTFGATGILNALDARTGAVAWSRNAATDTGTKTPDWGFASSPLVFDDLVVVNVSGALVAYDLATGMPRWSGPVGGEGYSSPRLVTIGGVRQILAVNGAGAIGAAPADGSLLWQHQWRGYPIVQPALVENGDVLLAVGDSSGVRRITILHESNSWSVEERWTSTGLKPYFNDFVVHDGHVFGFDGSILASINLADGTRTWKGGRYGAGQVVLLSDQGMLLVLSEEGELALVEANGSQFKEVARFAALEGKTWNHPVLVGDVLLVRNDHEMAAFRLSIANR
jgi:outer membrane protein assembly factor BamB